jgi:hypothetical protein
MVVYESPSARETRRRAIPAFTLAREPTGLRSVEARWRLEIHFLFDSGPIGIDSCRPRDLAFRRSHASYGRFQLIPALLIPGPSGGQPVGEYS